MSKYNMQNIFIWLRGTNPKSYPLSKWKHVNDFERVKNYLRLQIDNSIQLGWDKKDIIPITNFPFEHMGVKAYEAEKFCPWSSFVNKLVVVDELIEKGIITDNIWLHDCDCYQLLPFDFPKECKDWGYTRHHPRRTKNQGASGFFRKEAYDIIHKIAEEIQSCKPPREELFLPSFYNKVSAAKIAQKKKEIAACKSKGIKLAKMAIKTSCIENAGMYADRFSFLDYTYNLGIVKYFTMKYNSATKPINVLHFHTELKDPKDCFYFGKNRYNVKIVTDELEELLIKYKFIKEEERR